MQFRLREFLGKWQPYPPHQDVVITALKELVKQRSPYKAAQSLRAREIVFPLFPEELKYMETRSVLRQYLVRDVSSGSPPASSWERRVMALALERVRVLDVTHALGLEELANHPKFETNSKRTKNRGELAPLLEQALMGKTYQEWSQIFAEWGLPYAPINSVDKMVADPQVNQREMIVEFEHPIAGEVKMVGCPIKLSQTPPQMRMPPPILGQHTEEILKDLLGYSLEEVKELRRRKVIV